MKGRKWVQLTGRDLSSGELEGSSLQKAFGDVECPYCSHEFDAGTGEHSTDEMFKCPECECEFKVSWLEAK